MKERNVWTAALQGKCPRCREGDMFTDSPFNLKYFGRTRKFCPKCDLQFEQEPGFFYGAMYVSYALSVGIFLVTVFILYVFFNDPSLEVYVASVSLAALILYPLIFRYSRIIFIYVFGGIRYDPGRIK